MKVVHFSSQIIGVTDKYLQRVDEEKREKYDVYGYIKHIDNYFNE